jgi:hypothetical protein
MANVIVFDVSVHNVPNCPVSVLGVCTFPVSDERLIETVQALHILGFSPSVVSA